MNKKLADVLATTFLLSFMAVSVSSCSSHTHSYTEVDEVEATCLEKGVKMHYHCAGCGADLDINTKKAVTAEELEIAPLGHNFVRPGTYVKYPSCTEDGIIKRECSRCNITEEVSVSRTGIHNYVCEVESDEYLYSLGDCTTRSIYYKSCACGAKSENEFFEGDYYHELVHHVKAEPTDTMEGNIDYYSCSVCGKNFTKTDHYEELTDNPYFGNAISLYRKNGEAQDTLAEVVRDYLSLEDDPDTENNEIAQFMAENEAKFGTVKGSTAVTLSWSGENLKSPYTVNLYHDEELTDLAESITDIPTKNVEISNLIPATYYYQVSDSDNHVSYVDSFSFSSALRAINTNNTISNMRDIGGWVTQSGKKVKYGMIYRTAGWQSTSTDLDELILSLGIRSEIDVRISRYTGCDMTVSEHPIDGVNYFWTGFTDDYSQMMIDSTTLADVKNFFDILADKNNYPIAFHCAAGSDRTGFGAYLLECALGFRDEDIYRDYEVTSFFNEKRLRADVIQDEEGNYAFNPNGILTLPTWTPQFGRLTSFFLEPYKESDDTLSDTVIRFLKTQVGVAEETISNIRSILLA